MKCKETQCMESARPALQLPNLHHNGSRCHQLGQPHLSCRWATTINHKYRWILTIYGWGCHFFGLWLHHAEPQLRQTHIRIYTHIYMYIYIYIYIYVYLYIYITSILNAYINVYIYINNICIYIYNYMYTFINKPIYDIWYIYIYVIWYVYIYI